MEKRKKFGIYGGNIAIGQIIIALLLMVWPNTMVVHAIGKPQVDPDKVGLVIGGGSGQEPIFLEFIGKGYPDAVAMGNIFAAPSPDIILAATKAVDRGRGVLYVYGN